MNTSCEKKPTAHSQNILFLLFLVFSSVALSNFKFPNEAQQGTIFLNIERGLRLGLNNRQVGEKWVSDDCSYLCKGLKQKIKIIIVSA
jgi:hypothetical protein